MDLWNNSEKPSVETLENEKNLEKNNSKDSGNIFPQFFNISENIEETERFEEGDIYRKDNVFPQFFNISGNIEKTERFEEGNIYRKDNVFPKFFNDALEKEKLSTDIVDSLSSNECNDESKIDGVICEIDDNGNPYKENDKLIPDNTYVKNGIKYKTDSFGRIIEWNGTPRYNPDAERDEEAQNEAGGADRKEGDDGGHLEARILNGSPGNENIVAMRDTINRGDYKKSENEIIEAIKAGKDVSDSGKLIYDDNSERPSMFAREITYDNKKINYIFDNNEGSKKILDKIEGNISETDYNNIKDRISDMEEDGGKVSVTSVRIEKNEKGEVLNITVGIRDEIQKEKTYIKIERR